MSLPAAILCGGMATRLYPLTRSIPKALIEVAGEPFLAHQLRLLKASGIQHVVLCAGHLGGMLRDYAGDGSRFGLKVEYCFDGPVLLGTAGALKRAVPLLGDEFFVLYGDSYLPCDYSSIARGFQASGKEALMTVYRNLGQFDASNVEMTAAGAIRVYDKKDRTPAMQHIDYGLGVFRAEALARVPPGTHFDLAELYRQLLAQGALAAYEVPGRFYEIGSFQGIQELAEYLSARKER